MQAETPLGTVSAAGAGALLCAVLQGPGPVFALTSSLAQSTGLIGIADGTAILSGTALGAALGTALVGRAFGHVGGRLAFSHACLGLAMAVVILVGASGWEALADGLVVGDAVAANGAGPVLHPAMAGHLGAAFLVAQVAAVCVALALRTPVLRLTHGWMPERARAGGAPGARGASALARPLEACRRALVALAEIVRTREREPAVAAERAVAEARSAIEALLHEASSTSAESAGRAAAATACLHLASATEAALHVAEQALARDFTAAAADASRLDALHGLLVDGLDALLAHVDGTSPLALEEARAREIRLNALAESAARSGVERAHPAGARDGVAYRLWFGELAVAYEAVGNQLYRLANALAPEG